MSRLLTLSEQVLRPAVAGTVTAVWTIVASIAYASLVFSGALAPALAVGISTVISGFVISSVVIVFGSGYTGMTVSNLTVAAPVYAAMAAAISAEFGRLGVTDPLTQAAAVSFASGAATLLTGLSFLALASFRLGSLGQLLPYPVIAGYNSGIGWFLLVGGPKLTVDQPQGIDAAYLVHEVPIAQLAAAIVTATALVILPKRFVHWAVLPAALMSAVLLFHVVASRPVSISPRHKRRGGFSALSAAACCGYRRSAASPNWISISRAGSDLTSPAACLSPR